MTANTIPVKLFLLPHGEGLPLPSRATPHAAGMDLRAAIPEDACWEIKPGGRRLVPTGLVMAIPEGYEAQVRPRSGLALKHGVTVLNAPGTIDADYRNEVMVVLVNHGEEAFEIRRGERIAQILFAPVTACAWHPVSQAEALGSTERGLGGYGSTGRA
ncbi:MAG TPA: dUTP diphosphatase [Holophaga sp.]|nr:dUTP diphosphatase [Holophaga sp.]HPS66416.1 dUTP diphosphatase [Holophaga sp.]